jgi:hypothetical protein
MNPVIVEAMGSAPRCRYRRRSVILTFCMCVLPLAPRACVTANAQDGPSKGRIRVFVASDTERAVHGHEVRQVDVEESAKELRKRAKGLDWFQLADRPEDADLVVTVTGRRKDANKGYVLSYILEAGEYKVEDEFAFAGGTEISGGTRALGSDGRTNYDGRRVLSWDELAKQFARSLEAFARANYDRLLRQREQRQPK